MKNSKRGYILLLTRKTFRCILIQETLTMIYITHKQGNDTIIVRNHKVN